MENIREELKAGMERLGCLELRPFQEETAALFETGRDLYIQAKTGSGKTAAYLVPLLNKIPPLEKKTRVLIIVPTRELASQTDAVISVLAANMRVRSVCLKGGSGSEEQAALLAQRPGIITATAGRLLDLLKRGAVHTEDLTHIVLDEADLLLEYGQKDELAEIMSYLPSVQTALFSATLREELLAYLKPDPVIRCFDEAAVSPDVRVFYVTAEDPRRELPKLLTSLAVQSAIVFFRYRSDCETCAKQLVREGILAEALTGRLDQKKRAAVLRRFRRGETRVLCASDVAARGLDIKGVTHIIQYGLPYDETTYIHRAGRSMHEGGEGISILLLSEEEAASEEAAQYLAGARPLLFSEAAGDLSVPLEKEKEDTGIRTYYIRAGKKQGLRPGDIAGALSQIVPFEEIGTITVFTDHALVQILSETVLPSSCKIKGSVRKIEPVRNES